MTPSAPAPEPHGHDHTHGAFDRAFFATERGIRAVQISLMGLLATALLQVVVVALSGSVALLADTLHNFGDAFTAIPLWIAFRLGQRPPSKRFTYGYGRVEDLAGVLIVVAILASAALAGYESFRRLLDPQPVHYLGAVVAASVIGFLGNEAVALYRIRVGRAIGSAALEADGYHARVDGLTSLAVLVGAVGLWLGSPLVDPLVGLAISLVILRIGWQTGKSVFIRLLDGVDPEVVDEIRHAVAHLPEVQEVTAVRVRWLGHRMHAELDITVPADLSVEAAHDIARRVCQQLLRHLPYLSDATVHVDPATAPGAAHHFEPLEEG